MFKERKHSIIATAIIFAIALLICVSIFLPRNLGSVLSITGKPVTRLDTAQIQAQHDCFVEKDGKYNVIGNDPQIIFSLDGKTIESIEIKVDTPNQELVSVEVFTAYEDGAFSSERCYSGQIFDSKESAVIDIPKGEYYFIRVDINTDGVYFESLELYSQNPKQVPFIPNYTVGDYLKGIGIPLVIALIVWFVDIRKKIAEKIAGLISKNKLKILEFLVFTVVAILSGILIELLIGLILGDDFSKYRSIFCCGAAEIIFIFIYFRKDIAAKPEKLFLPLVLTLGIVMLFGSPLRHIAWDIDSHYPWAVEMSYIDDAYYSFADREIDINGAGELVGPFTELNEEKYNERIATLEQHDDIVASKKTSDFSLAHLPAGIFIAVARFFNAGFEFKYNVGRLANLLLYSIGCYFAIKRIKSGKMILSAICLLPTNLYLATNYSYDWCVTSLTVLGTAYFVSELQEPDKPITVKDTIIMSLAFAVGALPKLVYVVLMGMMLFMRKNWQTKKDRKRYYLILGTVMVLLVILFALRSMVSITGDGDTRGGAVNPSMQLAGILENPFGYAKILFGFLSKYLAFGTSKEYISNFAYLGIGDYWIVFAILLILVALTDASDSVSFKIPLYMRGLAVLLFVGMAALIASALYISYTPVGAETVNGCQPRYIIPMLAPLLLLVTGQRFNLIKNKAIYNSCVLGILSIFVMLETYEQIIEEML